MPSVKQFNSNLIIQSTGVSSNITLRAEQVNIPNNLTVTGDLTILGTTTSIETTNTTLKDNIIILNQGDTSTTGVTLGTAGIQVYRGANTAYYPSAGLIWNEDVAGGVWQITGNISNPSTFSNILSESGIGLTAVVDDTAPVLGGNLNVNGYSIRANVNANVKIAGNLQIISSITAGQSTTVYMDTPNNGSTGLYVVNDAVVNEELITKKRAFAFSLIL